MAIRKDVVVGIGTKYDGKGIRQANAGLKKLIGVLGIAAVGATLVRALSSAVKATAEFDHKMQAVKVISGATEKEFQRLKKTARELGATTMFTARQAASAMTEFSRAGFSAAETNKAIADTLALAAAGGTDLVTASQAMTATIKAFGLEASATTRLADIFTGAINNSRFTAESLNEALKLGAPAGAAFGQSVEDSVTAMAAFVDIVGTGSTAGMIYRNMLVQASKGSDKQLAALKRLGLTYDDINPKYNTAQQMLENLAKSQLSGADAAKEMAEIFTVRAGPAIASVVKRIKEGTLSFDDFKMKIAFSGDAMKSAAERTDTLQGEATRLKSAYESLSITIGTALTPALRNLTRGLIKGLENLENFSAQWIRFAEWVAGPGKVAVGGAAADFNKLGESVRSNIEANELLAKSLGLTRKEMFEIQKELTFALRARDKISAEGAFTKSGETEIWEANLELANMEVAALQKKLTITKELSGVNRPVIAGVIGDDGDAEAQAKRAAAQAKRTEVQKQLADGIAEVASKHKDVANELSRRLDLERQLAVASLEGIERIRVEATLKIEALRQEADILPAFQQEAELRRLVIIAEAEAGIKVIRDKSHEEELDRINKEAEARAEADNKKKAEAKALNDSQKAQAMEATQFAMNLTEMSGKERFESLKRWAAQKAGIAAAEWAFETIPFPASLVAAPAFGAAAFALINAIKFHQGGIVGGERAVIAQDGEAFLNKRATAGIGVDAVNQINETGRLPGGGGGMQVTLNITTDNPANLAESWRRGDLRRAYAQAMRRGDLKMGR